MVLPLVLEQLHGVAGHVPGQRIRHVIGVAEVAILQFVRFQQGEVLVLA
jgi:hypothetical protein